MSVGGGAALIGSGADSGASGATLIGAVARSVGVFVVTVVVLVVFAAKFSALVFCGALVDTGFVVVGLTAGVAGVLLTTDADGFSTGADATEGWPRKTISSRISSTTPIINLMSSIVTPPIFSVLTNKRPISSKSASVIFNGW